MKEKIPGKSMAILMILVIMVNLIPAFTLTVDATTNGTADGTYDFGGLGSIGSAGVGYTRLGDKFKVPDGMYYAWGSLGDTSGDKTALYLAALDDPATAVIKAEGGGVCKSFTFKDLGISANGSADDFTSLRIVLKDSLGNTLSDENLGPCAAGAIPTDRIVQLSSLYSHGEWNVAGVSTIEITFTLSGGNITILNFENIKLANISSKYFSAETPTITAQPSGATVNVGQTANITVAAGVSVGSLSYQWYSNTTNLNSGGNPITGATGATCSVPTASVGTMYYYCVVTNTDTGAINTTKSVTSNTAAVIVNNLVNAEPPTITVQPRDTATQTGNPASVSVTASGTGTLSYQWYRNTADSNIGGSPIAGATNPVYTVTPSMVGTIYYYCVITNTDTSVSGSHTASTTSDAAGITTTYGAGTFDFSGLGSIGSAGAGYTRLGDKFKVPDEMYKATASLGASSGDKTALYLASSGTTTAVIKAEGSGTCRSFTFKDLGISAYISPNSFTSLRIVLKDSLGNTLSNENLGPCAAGAIPTDSIVQLSSLYSRGEWNVAGVSTIEISFTLSSNDVTYIAFENIKLANILTNTAPSFVGSTTSLTVAQDSSAVSIADLMHVSDADSGQILTWSENLVPSHGVLAFTGATASSGGGDIAPGGTIVYTPTAGYFGTDSFSVQVSDGTETATRTITVNVVQLPSISVTGNITDTGIWAVSIPLTITASAEAGIQNVKVNGTDITASYAAGYTVMSNGDYTFTVTSNIGQTASQTVHVTQIDETAPNAPDVAGAESYTGANWYRDNQTISAAVIPTTGCAERLQYNLDSAGWTDGNSLMVGTEGIHTVQFRVIDALSRTSSIKTLTVQIDKTAPSAGISLAQSPVNTISNFTTFKLFFDNSVDVSITATESGSGLERAEYQKVADGDAFDADGAWTTGDSFSVAPDFRGTIYARAVDKAGNVSGYIAKSFAVDQTVPVISVASTPIHTTDPLAFIPVTITDSGAGVGTISYTIDGGTAQTVDLTTASYSDPTYSYQFQIGSLPVGVYDVVINARDNSGNNAVSVTVHVNAVLSVPTGLVWDGSTPGKAKWNAVDHASAYDVQLYKGGTALGSPVSVSAGTEYDFTADIAASGSGSYTFKVTAIGDGSDYVDSVQSAASAIYGYNAPVINATIFPATGSFDIYSPNDVKAAITWNSASAVNTVQNGTVPLVSPDDYVVSDSGSTPTLTIKKEYLETQSVGSLVLTISFDQGAPAILTIDITDTTPPYITPVLANYDLNATGNVITTITWNSASSVTDVVYGTNSLTYGTDYSIDMSTNILAINDTYLSGLGVSENDTLVFAITFNTGATASLTINVVDNYTPSGDAALSDLTVGGTTVNGFAPGVDEYDVKLPYGTQAGSMAVMVGATANDAHAQVSISQASAIPGSATVVVTAENMTSTKTYTINFTMEGTPAVHNITVRNDGNGTGSAYPTSAVQGAIITLNATANSGYHFKEWQVIKPAGLNISGNTFTMPDEAVTVKAIFEPDGVTTYTVTFNSNGSIYATRTVQAGASIGNWPANPTKSGYTFSGWYTGANGTGSAFTPETTVNATMTVYANWTANSSDSPNGSRDREDSTTPAPVTPAPGYSADISGIGATAVSLPVSVNAGSNSAVVNIGTRQESIFSGEGTTVITVPSIPGVNNYTISIPADCLSTPGGKGALTFNTATGSVTLPADMLSGIAGTEGKNVGITIGQGDKSALPETVRTAIGDRPLIQLSATIDGKQTEWSNPNTPVTIYIPYTPTADELANPESIIIWYIDGSGNTVSVPNGRYDPATGTVTFTTTHFSYYAVGYNKVNFNDVAINAWYNKAVGYIAARGITTGTGSGNYGPEVRLTRGEFLVMLMKAYEIGPDSNVTNNFSDAGNTYYTGYLAAAKRLGITGGTGGNMFAPNKDISRQEMFTMLYNALKLIDKLPQSDAGKTLSTFSDAGQVASWAKDAMTFMAGTGIIGGSSGRLLPERTATRAEMAQALYNLLSK